MEIIDNRALLLKLRNPGRVTSVIPKSKLLACGNVLVNWGLEEARVLKNLEIKNVPSPILGHYDWPGQYKPFDHQRTTSSFLTLHKRAFCFNEQGTGKSASVIWASDYLMKKGTIKRVLIVCPVSVMTSAWIDDLFTVAMHRTVALAHGHNRKARVKAIQSDAEYVVINYDGLAIVADEIKAGGFDLIVADEASALKTATTNRWKAFNSLVTPDTWLWLLTGTPAAQSPIDAYGLAKLVNPDNTPRFFNAFKDMVMWKITNFKWVPKQDAEHTVHNILQPAIRFTKEQCMDLPEVTPTTRHVTMTAQQLKYYEQVRKSMRTHADGENITAVNAATQINKLLQIACGSAYTDTGEVVVFGAATRMAALKETIEEASHKVLVFVPFRHTITAVHEYLRKHKITASVIDGSVSATKRTEIIKDFQTKKDPHVLVIQPQAAAHGITLTAANVVVWFAPTTSVETYLQANARVHRAGQRNPCTVVHLQGSGVEDRIYRLLRSNVATHTKIIDLYQEVLDAA